KESALLLTLGDTNDATYQGALNTYKTIAAYLGWQDKGFVAAKGVSEKAAVLKHEAFSQAETLGGTL
ncbi:MAG: hypothetical protein LBV52_02230, partial [Spirochaetaceae bacterium]|nr:hypothetical protein [Spirochaetaceae bacterium]